MSLSAEEHEDDARGIELTPVGYAVGEPADDAGEHALVGVVAPPAPARRAPGPRARPGLGRQCRPGQMGRPLAAAGAAAAIVAAYALGASTVSVQRMPAAARLHASVPPVGSVAAVPPVEPAARVTPRTRVASARGLPARREQRSGLTGAVAARASHAASAHSAARERVRGAVSARAFSATPPASAGRAYSRPAAAPASSPPVAVAASVARSQAPVVPAPPVMPEPTETASNGPVCYPGQLGC